MWHLNKISSSHVVIDTVTSGRIEFWTQIKQTNKNVHIKGWDVITKDIDEKTWLEKYSEYTSRPKSKSLTSIASSITWLGYGILDGGTKRAKHITQHIKNKQNLLLPLTKLCGSAHLTRFALISNFFWLKPLAYLIDFFFKRILKWAWGVSHNWSNAITTLPTTYQNG